MIKFCLSLENELFLSSKKKYFLFILLLQFSLNLFAQPTINSFSPTSGPVGATVTITGNNFSSTPANNIVFFGAVRATVTSASATSLSVQVPSGATYQPITVTTNNLTGYSAKPFITTFPGGVIHSKSFSYAGKADSLYNVETDDFEFGDLDGDGLADLAAVDQYNNTLSIYRNTSTGEISFGNKMNFRTGYKPTRLALGDIDGDGKLDIAVSNQYDNTVSVFKNTSLPGSISFAAKKDFATTTQPHDLIFDDLDGDGKTDLAIVGINTEGKVSLLRNTTSSEIISFAPKFDLVISLGISAIAAAKLDGDARPDLVFTGSYTDRILVVKNNSSAGSFSFTAATTQTTGRDPVKLAIGDLDGDGSSDIAVSNFYGNTISIFRNTTVGGSISFASKVDFSTYSADGVAIGDLDGDSKPDLAVTSTYVGIDVFKNNSTPGNISLLSKQGYTNNAVVNQMAIADLNNDGKADLAVESGIFRVAFWKNDVTKPSISSFTPTTAGNGATVTISGYNFSAATSVSFGGVPATSFTVINSTTITAVVGAAFSGDITVVTPNGTSYILGFVFAGPPLISSFTPTAANRQTTITINGKNFTGVRDVKFGGIPATAITVVSPTIITAVAGNGTSGDVSVTNAYGTGSLDGFNFIPPPTITSFSPTGALSGETVTITGTNLNGATAVSFGGTPSISFIVVSPTTINAVVGSGTSGNITVVTPGGSASKSGFGILPTISSFTPTTGARGTNVTITGTNFSEITGVRFGGANASFTVNSSTSISAIVGGGNSGDVSLITAAGTVFKPGFTFIPEPTLSSFTPKITGAGGTVTITGTNLSTATAVSFGGVAATSFNIINSTTIIAVVASGASGNIKITTTGGNASLSGFQFVTTPIINSFSPASGSVGTVVTIDGANFNNTPSNNIIYFGGVKASVISGTSNRLTVIVPAGANYKPISVTTNGKSAYSMSSFAVTFPGVGAFNANSFAGRVDFTTGGNPESIACGDLDGDGKADVVVANTYSNTLSFFRNTSTLNSLSFATGIDSIAGLYPHAVKIADIDNDGRLDVLLLNFGEGGLVNTITIFKNLSTVGNLSFQSKFILKTDFHPQDLAIADRDLDGKPDLAITHYGTSTSNREFISMFQNRSTGGTLSFGPPAHIVTSPLGTSSFFESTVSSADLDSDGRPDLVVGFEGGDFFSVIRNASYECYGGCWYGNGYAYVSTADFDGDSKADVITNDHIFRNAFNGISLGFDWQRRRGIGGVLAVDNLSGSAIPDFVRINPSANTVSAVKNLSTVGFISFAANVDYNTATTPSGIVTTDFNGDGKADVAITNKSFNTFSILLNSIGDDNAPSLKSFSPTSGNAGTEVTITGANLIGVTGVRFGEVAASSFTVVNSTTITAVVGNGASGNVSITTATDTISLGWFYYTPSITSFTPTNAGKGIIVTITGDNFTGATAVSFGGVAASSFTVLSPTTIAAVVANGASGEVSVTTPAGTATASGFTYVAAPTITTFTPASGGKGTAVNITGTNFTGATSVRFGSTPATSFTVISSTTMTAVVDNGSTGNIFVTTPGGTANSTIFTFIPSPTTIISFTPTSGGTGASVTITGTNFTGATAVSFGGTAAQSFTVNSSTSITAVLGAGASGNVRVTTPDGTATLAGFIFISAPTITSLAPTSGATGASITITGTNFTGTTAVSFGGTAATSFTINSSTSITAVVGNGASGNVSVTTPGGTARLGGFTFISAPAIASFTPTSAASGATVTITGTNLTGATAVSFGGVTATSFTVNSSTNITAIVGAGASGNVSVTTPGGTATLSGFIFIAQPTITSFTPTIGGVGTSIVITGANFTNATDVSIGDIPVASFTINSPTSITAIVGTGATGNVSVTTAGGTAILAGFTFMSPPTITTFTPEKGRSGITVTITGTNFNETTTVSFGGVPAASFIINSSTSISAVVGAGASGDITVTTPYGTATAGGFAFEVGRGVNELVIYPNPADEFVLIKHPSTDLSAQLKVIDLTGKVVKVIIPERNASETRIDLKGLKQGIYEVVWSDGKNKASQKLMLL